MISKTSIYYSTPFKKVNLSCYHDHEYSRLNIFISVCIIPGSVRDSYKNYLGCRRVFSPDTRWQTDR